MALTYDNLLNETPLWLYAGNRALVDNMPDVILKAERQLVLVIDHDLFRTTLPITTLPAGVSVVDLSDHDPLVMEVRGFRVRWRDGDDQWTPILPREAEYLTMLYSTQRPGRPKYYTQDGGFLQLQTFPTPDRDYDVEITANLYPPALGGSPVVEENVLTKQFPRAFEMAVYRQAAIFMKDDAASARYDSEMMAAIPEANTQSARRRRDETGQRPHETANASGR
jgi:hypothetical protein